MEIRTRSWSKGGPCLRKRIRGRRRCVPSRLVGVSEPALTLGITKAASFDQRPIRFEMLASEKISTSNRISGSRSEENRHKNNKKQVHDGNETPSRSNSEKRSASVSRSARWPRLCCQGADVEGPGETCQNGMKKDLLDTSSESDLSHLHPHLQDVLEHRCHLHLLPNTSGCVRNRLDYDMNARSPISDRGEQSGNIPRNHIHRPLRR